MTAMPSQEVVFPALSPRPKASRSHYRSSSLSSSSENQANAEDAVSYVERLKRTYCILVKVPEELCPSSRPSSPSAEIRIERLQSKIASAALSGRYLGDLVHLRCARRSATSVPITIRKSRTGTTKDKHSFILPETEEEWFQWERAQASRRGQGAGQPNGSLQNGLFALDQDSTQSAEEKVKEWKESLRNVQESSQSTSTSAPAVSKRPPRLEFPVVKPSASALTRKKGNPPGIRPGEFYGTALAILREGTSERPLSQKSEVHHQPLRAQKLPSTTSRTHSKKTPSIIEIDIQHISGKTFPLREKAETKTLEDLSETTFFLPPTFESDVITSTPNGQKVTEKKADHDLINRDEDDSHQEQPKKAETRKASMISLLSSNTTPPLKRRRTANNVVTPPTSMTRPYFVPDKSLISNRNASGLLTPCSDDYTASRPVSQPQTQEHQKKTVGSDHNAKSSVQASEHLQPSSELGNAKGLPVPRTPDRNSLPTMNELLATSRRSKKRSQPQLRKVQIGEKHFEGRSYSQASSSYLSSPASGNLGSPSALRYIAQSSPLSPKFTQNLSQFAPPLTSTQPAANGSPGNGGARPKFTGIPRTASIRSTIASQGLTRSSSGLAGMVYNSQVNVEERVDGFINFLEKDLNFDRHLTPEHDELEDADISG